MNFMNPPTAQESSHSVNIFCEETVRYSFVSHLAAALRREGIFVFVDACSNDHNLAVTDGIHVLVFPFMMKSYHYFMSKVVKVSKIIKSSRNNYAYPEFYCVDPLTQVHGWESDVLEYINCPEYYVMYFKAFTASEIVDDVVREISGKFYRPEPVGIYSRLLELRDMLHKQPWGICRSIGIWGMPGIGKTTLAKAVFNHMCNDYDASCFIENFDEAFHKEGLHRLLDEKIGKILKKKFDINSSYTMRPSLLRDNLCDTSILVVLDDVRNPLFAESFLERLDCFGPGRLVIMTSRDKTVFPFCQINHIYEVQGLNEHEALQLFSHSVFRRSDLVQKEMELSMKVIDYANGNPLALRIYGKELKKNMSEMEAAFLKLKQYPPKEIQDVLKSVYIALDDNEKNIFWDIACVFRGENVDNVVQVLEGWRYFPRIGIDVLVEKCLVTISKNTLHMNNLILSLLSGETESCTRMCEPSSIRYLLEDYEFEASGEPKARPNCVLVVEDIEIISIDTSNLTFNVRHDAFKNMINLKFLKIYRSCSEYTHGLNFPKGLDFLPSELRLLNWENYPFQSLPQDSDFGHLVELNMPYSQLHKLETKTKLKMLKRIVLCHSERLYECDIPLYAQNIELIDLQGCTRLQSFPDTSQLQHLRVVNLSGCIEIKVFKGAPPNIQELHLQGTNIKEIPISIMSHSLQKVKLDRQKLLNLLENFQDVEYIDLESVTELVKVSSYNQGFGKLVHLNMKDCSHLRSLPDMVNLESLQVLHLSGCSKLEEIKGFPKNIRKLYFGGTAVQEVPQFPKSLEFLNAHGCTYLKSVCLDFEHLPVHYTFSNCFNCSLSVIAEFLEKGLTRIASLARAQKQEFIKAPEVSICIPAGTRQRSSLLLKEGPNVMTNLDPWTRKPLSGFAMSVVVSFQDDYHNTVGLGIRCTCTWKDRFHSSNKKIERIYQCWAPREAPKVEWDHLFIFYDTQMHPSGSEVKFEFDTVSWENELLGANCRVTQCGVQIITAPTNDTIPSEFTRESEATSITDEEHHPPTSSRVVEAKIPSPPLSSSEPRKVSSKLRYKGTMFWKWVKTIRRDKKKKSLTDREQVDLTQPSMIRSENLPR